LTLLPGCGDSSESLLRLQTMILVLHLPVLGQHCWRRTTTLNTNRIQVACFVINVPCLCVAKYSRCRGFIRIRVPFPQGENSLARNVRLAPVSRPDGITQEAHLLFSDPLTNVQIIPENSNTSFITTLRHPNPTK